jgi:hypothetical protein
MLLGGKGGCQQCGCVPGCPECRHYIVDTYYETAEVTVTVNGSSVPWYNPEEQNFPASFLYITPSGGVMSTCFLVSDSPKRAAFHITYGPSGDSESIDVGGCYTYRVVGRLTAAFPESSYSENASSVRFTYDIALNCDDTGGTAVLGSWSFDDTTLPEDCYIEYLEWLDSLEIIASFSWDPCTCPP